MKDVDPGPQYLRFTPPRPSGPINLDDLSDGAAAIEYFQLFFTNDIVDLIVSEINRYAEEKIARGNLKPHSRLHNWKPTDRDELLRFIGILLNMGIVRLPTVQMY